MPSSLLKRPERGKWEDGQTDITEVRKSLCSLALQSLQKKSLQGLADRERIVRGFFHRENRILLRKSQIFDLDTLFCSLHYCKKKFKKLDLLGLWKNPLTIPYLLAKALAKYLPGFVSEDRSAYDSPSPAMMNQPHLQVLLIMLLEFHYTQ